MSCDIPIRWSGQTQTCWWSWSSNCRKSMPRMQMILILNLWPAAVSTEVPSRGRLGRSTGRIRTSLSHDLRISQMICKCICKMCSQALGILWSTDSPLEEYLIRISLFFVFWFGALFCWPLSCGLLRYHLEFVSWFHAKDDLPFYFRFFLSFWRGFSFLAVLVCVVIVRRFGSLILSANWFRHTIT